MFAVALVLLATFSGSADAPQRETSRYCWQLPEERLAGIDLEQATDVQLQNPLHGMCWLRKLPGGAVLLQGKMDIDADGSPRVLDIDPEEGQLMTAYRYRGYTGQAAFVDAESVPY